MQYRYLVVLSTTFWLHLQKPVSWSQSPLPLQTAFSLVPLLDSTVTFTRDLS